MSAGGTYEEITSPPFAVAVLTAPIDRDVAAIGTRAVHGVTDDVGGFKRPVQTWIASQRNAGG